MKISSILIVYKIIISHSFHFSIIKTKLSTVDAVGPKYNRRVARHCMPLGGPIETAGSG